MLCSRCRDARLENIGSLLLNNYIRAAEERQQEGGASPPSIFPCISLLLLSAQDEFWTAGTPSCLRCLWWSTTGAFFLLCSEVLPPSMPQCVQRQLLGEMLVWAGESLFHWNIFIIAETVSDLDHLPFCDGCPLKTRLLWALQDFICFGCRISFSFNSSLFSPVGNLKSVVDCKEGHLSTFFFNIKHENDYLSKIQIGLKFTQSALNYKKL